ncbi:CAP-Gly domain-containing linker protein 1-like [Pelobates fuscus]|uniref:CAP-Gly domain-containing linker protein 1-like n=1 Tax=Pelobates fuscus TaxID=191477 RepID=UPI002FE4D459
MSDLCRLCSSPLRGSRRKWLFGGSGSDSLPVLFSRVLGSPVTRTQSGSSHRHSRGRDKPEDCEFICGKCCHSLNVYHRYDQVMSRMRHLYEQRSARLLNEREKLSYTLRRIHAKAWNLPLPDYQEYINECKTPTYGSYCDLRSLGRHGSRHGSISPGYQNLCPDSPFPDQESSFNGSFRSLSGSQSKSYQQLLDKDRLSWEHESWWEDRGDTCFRCIKGDKCHSCSSWRVPDANYETVCTVPRRKKHSRGEEGRCCSAGLLRSKSLGSVGGGSSRGSLLSFSTSSLEALSITGEEEAGVFSEPHSPVTSPPPSSLSTKPMVVEEALKSLKEIKYSAVMSPRHSRIPVKRRGPLGSGSGAEDGRRKMEEESRIEVPLVEITEDYDTFMGIGSEICQTHVSRIQETLKWLQTQPQAAHPNEDTKGQKDQQDLVRELIKSLQFKEEVLEDCLTLLLTLPVASDAPGDTVMTFIEKLNEREQALKKEWSDLAENKQNRDAETKRLRLELAQRQEDLERLARVLRENQDTITALRDHLGEKEFTIQQLEVALDSAVRSAASQDALRLSALREKDALISSMQGVLSSSNQDVEALADSLLSQGLDDLGGSIPGTSSSSPLITQLQEKGRLLSQSQTDNQKQSVQHQKDIQDLLNALNESQTLLQEQLRYCKGRLQAGELEQKRLREALRGQEAELRAEKQRHAADMYQAHTELVQLQGATQERDKTTQKLLQEAQGRDQIIKRLQERLSQGGGMRDTL